MRGEPSIGAQLRRDELETTVTNVLRDGRAVVVELAVRPPQADAEGVCDALRSELRVRQVPFDERQHLASEVRLH